MRIKPRELGHLISGLQLYNLVVFVGVLWGRWQYGVKFSLLFPCSPSRHELLKLLSQELEVDLPILSPYVEENMFNSFIAACVKVVRGRVLLRLLKIFYSPLFSLSDSGLLDKSFLFGSLAVSLFSCLDLFF